MKTTKELFELYRPKAEGEQDFVDKHVVIKHKDRNGNGDDLFKGKTKSVNRKKERHGYDAGDDEKVYEETEDLDELSKTKVSNYLNKAAPSYDKATKEVVDGSGSEEEYPKSMGTMLKRAAGDRNAKLKLAGKAKVNATNEDLDEAVSVSHDRYLRSHGKKATGNGAWIFTNKKNGNIDLDDHKKSHIGKGTFADASKSAKKWAKEHGHSTVYVAENFDEDSVRTYVLEMADLSGEELQEEQIQDIVEAIIGSEAVKNPYAVGMAAAMKSTGDTPPLKKSTIRKGHEIAKKLTKEDVINRTIEKYIVSEEDLPTPTDRLLAKLDGLSEAHIDTLVTVFENLNEDNQMKMLSAADTHEGVLNLLDFAIKTRGV